MKYSIIVPVYNRPDETEELLASLCEQARPDMQVIIVEDGSQIPCEYVVKRYARRMNVEYFNKENGGPAAARNFGAQHAKGEYLISKRRYSAFFATDLEILLKGLKVDTLYMIGGLTDVCIHYTAVDAHQHDYHIRVVTDAVAGSSDEAHRYALQAIKYLQRDALVTTADIEAAQ